MKQAGRGHARQASHSIAARHGVANSAAVLIVADNAAESAVQAYTGHLRARMKLEPAVDGPRWQPRARRRLPARHLRAVGTSQVGVLK